MGSDQFSLLDILILSLFCVGTWVLDFVFRPRKEKIRKLQYHIHPMDGRKFYWRRSEVEKEEHGSFNI